MSEPATESIPHSPLYLPRRSAVRVELRDADEVDAMTKGPAWVIDGLLQEGVNVLYGSPGSGKTFVALDMAMHIAVGEPVWHGRRVSGGPVVYIAAEDGVGASLRRNAWRQYHRVSGAVPMLVYDQPIYLANDEYVDGLIVEIQAKGVEPALIVFDTLARCVPGKDENGSGDMGVAVDSLERILRETGGRAAMLLHHPSKQGGGGPRGSSAIPAAAQGVVKLTGNPAEGVTLTVEKQRSGAKGDSLSLLFQAVGDTLVVTRGNEKPWNPQALKQTQARITKAGVTAVLRRAKTPLTPDAIADRLGVPTSVRAVTAHLSRLVKNGAVVRDDVGYIYVSA